MRFPGKVVLVTGASSGIGAATAVGAARRGARAVALLARNAAALEEVAGRVRALGSEALALPADLGDDQAAQGAVASALSAFGPPDVLVNNAGAGRWWFVEETPPGEAQAAMAVPYLAAFHVTRAALPSMLARGSGRIVNVTSPAAFTPWPGSASYASARWAVRGFDEALGADLRGTGVGTSLFTPATVRSGYWKHNPGAEERLPGIGSLFGSLTPEEAAEGLLRTVERERRRAFLPRRLWLAAFAAGLAPDLVSALVAARGTRRPGR
jgi:short-subunit dehydrogenase